MLLGSDRVFVDGLAKVLEIVGGNLKIVLDLFGIFFREAQLAWSRRQSYLHSIRISTKDLRPFAQADRCASSIMMNCPGMERPRI